VAVFVTEIAHQGQEAILDTLEAIAALHDRHGLANPGATAAVRLALLPIAKEKPPRSWNKQEKIFWGCLPSDVAHAVLRSEDHREKYLRRRQNEFAEEKKRLAATAETKSAESKEETANAH
jgi:hypothetical protein